MSPRFLADYMLPVVVEEDRPGLFRCHALDTDGEGILGAYGASPLDAIERLSSFVDGELARRGVPL